MVISTGVKYFKSIVKDKIINVFVVNDDLYTHTCTHMHQTWDCSPVVAAAGFGVIPAEENRD